MSPDNSNGLHFKELFGVTSSLLTFLPVWLIPRGRGSSITPAGGSTAGTSGAHLFQGRFDAVLVGGEGEWLEVARYVHLNLVRVARLGLPKSDQQQRQKTAAAART